MLLIDLIPRTVQVPRYSLLNSTRPEMSEGRRACLVVCAAGRHPCVIQANLDAQEGS
jgi:hypothetical protein